MFKKILVKIGLPLIFKSCNKFKVVILVFHKPSPKNFAQAISYLVEHYSIIELSKIENYKISKSSKFPLVITFDDGHKSNYDLLHIIRKYKIPVTIFLTSGVIGTNRHFWFIKKNELKSSFNLKKMSNQKRLEDLSVVGFDQLQEYENSQALSREQIMEMTPYVDFQSHTMFHPILPMCDYKTARFEIKESKKILEEEYGFNIYALAYPNGDYSEREIEICKEAGYKMGLTTESGFNDYKTDSFMLKRIGTNDTEDINEFILRVSGVWHIGLKLKRFLFFWK